MFSFQPELFEQRAVAMDALADKGFEWLDHYSAVDLLHETTGLEVCGIKEEKDGVEIQEILKVTFPKWRRTSMGYHDGPRDLGWKVIISERKERGNDFKAA